MPQVLPLLSQHGVHALSALGVTRAGFPRHPLMVPSDAELHAWKLPRAA